MTESIGHSAMLETIQQSFARGASAQGEDLLTAALEAGVPWDLATRAVAQGVARRFGLAPSPDGSSRRPSARA